MPTIFYVIYLFIFLFSKFNLHMAEYTHWWTIEYPQELQRVLGFIESTN